MILESKLSRTAYPVADPDKYLTGDKENLDPVLAGRVAYVFKVASDKAGTIIKCHVTDGYRTHADQEKLYDEKQRGLRKSAEIPGRSWHEYSLAIDTSTSPIRQMSSHELHQYGLAKPIKGEGWHIQPIETVGISNRTTFAPFDLIPLVKQRFEFSDDTIRFLTSHPMPYFLFKKLYERQ
jgi:hypothetical protein